jgi:hypothetical protein
MMINDDHWWLMMIDDDDWWWWLMAMIMMVMLILTKFYFIQGVISVVTKIFFTVQRLAIVIKNSWRKWFGSRDSHAVWKGKYTTKLFIVVTNNNGPIGTP